MFLLVASIALVSALHRPAAAAEVAPGPAVVTFQIANQGTRENNLAVTFGSVFARGDVPRGIAVEAVDGHGDPVPLQLDRKATHADGSLRHAVVTLVIPHLAKGDDEFVTLRRRQTAREQQGSISLSDLPPDFDTAITLSTNGHHLTASARALLSTGKPEIWLDGPLVTEWWVHGPFRDEHGTADPHLSARFGIRCYGKDQPLRLDVIVENDRTYVPQPQAETYDAEIRADGRIVFAKQGITQPAQSRWRRVFWWNQPVSLYVKQNLDYLKKARVIPNYQPGLTVSADALDRMYDRFENADRDPMETGIVWSSMPTTGGRPDIAPLPQWQAMYLLSMDPRAYEVTLASADLGGSFPTHYRNEKTDRPVTFEDDPDLHINGDLPGRAGEQELPAQGRRRIIPDPAHEPALDFLPYLITGDLYYLEELEFWSQWNAMGSAPEVRTFKNGFLGWGQVRGQAWSLRTLAQAAYIAPDADPLKGVLRRQLKANIDWYENKFSNDPAANKLGILSPSSKTRYDSGISLFPWQDDFFTWSVGYAVALGDADALPLLRWKATFPVGRMTAPGFCWILGSAFALRARDPVTRAFYPDFADVYRATLPLRLKDHAASSDPKCGSAEMAQALGLTLPGEMIQNPRGTDGYPAYMQAALAAAVDSGIPGASAAWRLFESRSVKPDYANAPGWDIVPWQESAGSETR